MIAVFLSVKEVKDVFNKIKNPFDELCKNTIFIKN
jgi:hypothetical protein